MCARPRAARRQKPYLLWPSVRVATRKVLRVLDGRSHVGGALADHARGHAPGPAAGARSALDERPCARRAGKMQIRSALGKARASMRACVHTHAHMQPFAARAAASRPCLQPTRWRCGAGWLGRAGCDSGGEAVLPAAGCGRKVAAAGVNAMRPSRLPLAVATQPGGQRQSGEAVMPATGCGKKAAAARVTAKRMSRLPLAAVSRLPQVLACSRV